MTTPGPARATPLPGLDAIVLAGGRARRLGGADKAHVELDGRGLLAHVLDGLAATGLVGRAAVVGPSDAADDAALPLVRVQEDPPFGGPVAGIGAGLAALGALGVPGGASGAGARQGAAQGDRVAPGAALDEGAASSEGVARETADVVVLACDVPGGSRLVPGLVAALAAAPDADGACVRADGRDQWLLAVYRRPALAHALAALRAERGSLTDASVRGLVAPLTLVRVDDTSGASADVDTWADLDALRRPPARDGGRSDAGRPPRPGG